MSGLLLGIETSNPTAGPRGEVATGPRGEVVLLGPGVALAAADGGLLGAEPLREGSRHDDALMPAIARLCDRLGVTPRDLARVAVSAGPGGYTGLRIAVTTAKMIAEATGCQTVAVPSALVAAWRLPGALAPALVCLASKKEKAHGTLLPDRAFVLDRAAALEDLLGAGGLRRLRERTAAPESHEWLAAATPLGLIGPDTVRRLAPRTLIADQHLPDAMRAAALEVGASVVAPQFAAASVCRIGRDLEPPDPAGLTPFYAREPDAVTQWRARRANAPG